MKKRIGMALITMLLFSALVGSSIYTRPAGTESVMAETQTEEKQDAAKPEKKEAADKKKEKKEDTKKEKTTEEKKETADKKENAASSQASETQAGTSGSGNSNSAGSGTGSQAPAKQKVWHEPVYESRYVVDQAAWTETINEPIYEMQEIVYCSTCGAVITGFAGQHLDETRHGGYWSDAISVQVGTNTYTVTHPEQGHYESVLVREGYWE